MGARETTHARRRAAPPQSSARRDVEGADGARIVRPAPSHRVRASNARWRLGGEERRAARELIATSSWRPGSGSGSLRSSGRS